ncbi:MAG: hypothetical protein COA94_00410 [Rickettsiales bacterium]|nr:MAG: hypothetical protein COA94_00410 [Rickettsiales bacterium]
MSFIDNFCIRFFAKHVGSDRFGNKYYLGQKKNYLGKAKRFVTYNGQPNGAKVPPDWHRWLHYSSDDLPEMQDAIKLQRMDAGGRICDIKYADISSASSSKSSSTYSSWSPNQKR